MTTADERPLSASGIQVSPVAMGCWPIAGISSLNVNDSDSLATLQAALDSGITHFDTAHCYGYDGESEKLIARALNHRRGEFSLATKVGIAYDSDRVRRIDGRPKSLRRQFEISLKRLGADSVELLYLHSPDPQVPIEESAAELARFQAEGQASAIGLSNATLEQTLQFQAICPIAAIQVRFNMLQREAAADLLPWCRRNDVAFMAYWPLMKGLLAGRLDRDHQFDPMDPRLRYPIFQGKLWQANQDFLDEVRCVARTIGKTVVQVVVNWTANYPAITSALCGAKRPDQIRETAASVGWTLDETSLQRIASAYQRWQEATSDPTVLRQPNN